MSQYTTGELAKLCGITVRTVQFYDQRGILIPSSLTEGGRRLYSEEDLKQMKIICFLRDTGLSLDTIGQLLKEEDPGSVIAVMLELQEKVLREEIGERREKLDRLAELKSGLDTISSFSIESIGDIATVMESKKKLNAMYRNMILTGIPFSFASSSKWTDVRNASAVLPYPGSITTSGAPTFSAGKSRIKLCFTLSNVQENVLISFCTTSSMVSCSAASGEDSFLPDSITL